MIKSYRFIFQIFQNIIIGAMIRNNTFYLKPRKKMVYENLHENKMELAFKQWKEQVFTLVNFTGILPIKRNPIYSIGVECKTFSLIQVVTRIIFALSWHFSLVFFIIIFKWLGGILIKIKGAELIIKELKEENIHNILGIQVGMTLIFLMLFTIRMILN